MKTLRRSAFRDVDKETTLGWVEHRISYVREVSCDGRLRQPDRNKPIKDSHVYKRSSRVSESDDGWNGRSGEWEAFVTNSESGLAGTAGKSNFAF